VIHCADYSREAIAGLEARHAAAAAAVLELRTSAVDSKFILVTLLIKLGVAAAVASALVRSRYFKQLVFREERSLAQVIHLVLLISVPFALGVVVRVGVRNFLAADVAFESAILIGVIGGPLAGALGAAMLGAPATFNGEYLALPFYLASGLLAGVLRKMAQDKEEIWSFTPFVDLSIYRWIRRHIPHPRLDWQTTFFLVILAMQFLRQELGSRFPGLLFYLPTPTWGTWFAVYGTAVAAVAIPLKIWNNTRIEMKLEQQERLLLHARLEALQSQVNPHFLFNTLNSIASLVRFDPDMARVLIVKLANILRRILRKSDTFVRLRDELEFIDDYLDIEVVRFGRDKLRVVKQLDPATLDLIVPSMLLQPLIENSIKHGLSPKIEGGSINLRSRLSGANLVIEVQDDGVGMSVSGEVAGVVPSTGIGMSNVAERLKVLYGESASMIVSNADGRGTRVTIQVPILDSSDGHVETASGVAYSARSSTQR
jgi:two-component system LytT family sensor kinase